MKLSPLTIYLIGLFLAIPILAFGFFMNWMPNEAEAGMYNDVLPQFQAEGAKMPQAQKRVQDAVKLVQQSAADWRSIVAVRTPVTGIERGGAPNLAVNAYQLSVDTRKFRNNLQRAINNQLHAAGVKVLSGPFVQDIDLNASNELLTSYYNYATFGFPIVILNLGEVQVQGKSYKQIFDHVKSWSNFPHYLAVTDSLALTGTTPSITGRYNLTVVAFIRGKVIAPPVNAAPASTTGGSPFGGPGGSPFGGPPSFGGPGGPPGVPGAPGMPGRGGR